MHKGPPFNLRDIVVASIKKTLTEAGYGPEPIEKPSATEGAKESLSSKLQEVSEAKPASLSLTEAMFAMPRSFLLKTERLSSTLKQAHESFYKNCVEAFNKIGPAMDAASTESADENSSAFRSLKLDELSTLNAVKLHELYFSNISDVASEISIDTLPYMRLARDFGSFEKWQFNFMACAMSSGSGWAVTYYEPYRNTYINGVIDGNNLNIPLGAIPIVVMDLWEHAYQRDYGNDKKAYLVAMMRELNWNVIEARMMVAEKSDLENIYRIIPVTNDVPQALLAQAQQTGMTPVVDIAPAAQATPPPTPNTGPLAPPAPPSPAMQTPAKMTGR